MNSWTIQTIFQIPQYFLISIVLFFSTDTLADQSGHCDYYQAGSKNLYWGDLHVHTAYSLDAYAFGTLSTPAQAYAFARGAETILADGSKVKLDRPLDFVAVTDHAEWFDLMHICTDPQQFDNPYCNRLRQESSPTGGGALFVNYVIPTITLDSPAATPICKEDPQRCNAAIKSQWERVQQQANDANDACKFTAQIGYEWSYTKSFSHSHRNIIFKNENVTREAIDYIRYPTLNDLWQQLDKQCLEQNDCDVIAIPHNTNMGDGMTFDVDIEDNEALMLRAKYEKLVEIHQEKGNSECLSPLRTDETEDCGFEPYLTNHSRPTLEENFTDEQWEKMRSSYVRSLLLKGLQAYGDSPDRQFNPLQLGVVGSTDTHLSTPGFVEEALWKGPAFGLGDFDAAMRLRSFNPGGLVAVWAEENTRESIFSALKRREVYGTSGPRIKLKLSVSIQGKTLSCRNEQSMNDTIITMGGQFNAVTNKPYFKVEGHFDKIPLEQIEIVKGEYFGGKLNETVVTIWQREDNGESVCQVWADENFEKSAPAFWYARVKEMPTQRWSSRLCAEANRCDEFPGANIDIQERAWTSPVWYLP